MPQDVGLVSENNMLLAIDKNKIHKERQRYRKKIQRQERENRNLVESIYIDGRKNATQAILQDLNGKLRQKIN